VLLEVVVSLLEFLSLLLVNENDSFVSLEAFIQFRFAIIVESNDTVVLPHILHLLELGLVLLSLVHLSLDNVTAESISVGNNLGLGVVAVKNSPLNVSVVLRADGVVRVARFTESLLELFKLTLVALNNREGQMFNISTLQFEHKFLVILQVQLNIDIVGTAVTTEQGNEAFKTLDERSVVLSLEILAKVNLRFFSNARKDIVQTVKGLVGNVLLVAGVVTLVGNLLGELGNEVFLKLNISFHVGASLFESNFLGATNLGGISVVAVLFGGTDVILGLIAGNFAEILLAVISLLLDELNEGVLIELIGNLEVFFHRFRHLGCLFILLY